MAARHEVSGTDDHLSIPRSTELVALAAAGAVAVLGTVSLALAQLGVFDGEVAVASSVALLVVAGLALRRFAPTAVTSDRKGLAVTTTLFVLLAAWFLPGAPYALGDKDPGVYVSHAFAIERTGSNVLDDPALERLGPDGVVLFSPGARFPGLWIDPDDPTRIEPQFFHLWPSMQAVGVDLIGARGAFHLAPLLAALAVVLLGTAVRAALDGPEGAVAGVVAGGLLAANMLEVWQARYPTTEVLSQLLFAGTLLGAAVAMRTGWGPAAGAAGLLASVGFLTRPDGILLVGLVAVALGVMVATRRAAGATWWLAGGLALPLPYALFNAYVSFEGYTLGNGVPSARTFAAALGGVAVAAVVGRRLWPRLAGWLRTRTTATAETSDGADAHRDGRRLPTLLAVAVLAGAAVGLVLFWYRQRLLGEDTFLYNGTLIRSFDELNLRRLAYFTTRVALIAAWGGLVVTLLRPRLPIRLVVLVAPGLAVAPVYLWEARNSPRLMWWGRRYVPWVLPTLFVLVAVLVAYLLVRRGRWRWPSRALGAAILAFLLVDGVGQSLDLRGHREMGGSWSLLGRIESARAGNDAVFLWRAPEGGIYDGSRNLGGPMFMVHGQPSALLRPEPTQADVDAYRTAFPDHELFVVTQGTGLPGTVDPEQFELVDDFTGQLTIWEETLTERPDEQVVVEVPVRVYRLLPAV